ncbi:MAG: lipoxygenase family protein [Pseudomonadota bacterium]
MTFTLDGQNAINDTNNGKVSTSDSTGKMSAFQLTVPKQEIGGNWNGMTIFITSAPGEGELATNGDLDISRYKVWKSQQKQSHYSHTFFKNVIPVAIDPIDDREEGGITERYDVLRNANKKFAEFLFDTATWEADVGHLSSNFFKTLPTPKGATPKLFEDDEWFTNFLLRGPDPTTLELASPKIIFPQSLLDILKQSNEIEGFTRDLNNGKIFHVDFSRYSNVKSSGRFASWPHAVFRSNKNSNNGYKLEPVAITLIPPGHDDQEITLLAGKNHNFCSWNTAKRVFLSAAANYHELATHLGRTHLVMERFALATYRQLPPWHPVGRLLRPHFKFMVATNNEAFKKLINEGGPIDKTFMASADSLSAIAIDAFKSWELNVHGGIESDLERRGLLNNTNLPFWPYKDYGLKLYKVIHSFVNSYLRLWYAADGMQLNNDVALKNWRKVLREDYKAAALMSENASFEDLVTACTNIIWTCGPQHSAVNYSQYDFLADGNTLPFCIQQAPNKAFTPTRSQIGDQAEVIARLSLFQYDKLGDYSTQSFLTEYGDLGDKNQPWQTCIKNFQTELTTLAKSQKVKAGDDWGIWDYPFLNPELIANSISI